MSKYLSKNQIISAIDDRYEDVEVPEWGGTVRVKAMSGVEKDAFEASVTTIRRNGNKVEQRPNLENVRAKLLAHCIVDESGALIFDDDDIAALGSKSSAALDRVVDVAKRLNRMTNGAIQELSETLKNGQPAAGPTD